MTVTAILTCTSKEGNSQSPEQGNVRFSAAIEGGEEVKRHFSFTPYADLRLGILNPSAYAQFEPGKTYLVTIEEYQAPA